MSRFGRNFGGFGRNLDGRIQSCLQHVRHDAVAMATAVA